MLSREVAINEYQLAMFYRVVDGLSNDLLFTPSPGHGHPPAWILGHLAVCAELGQRHLGGELEHPTWVALFGTGSSDQIVPDSTLTLELLRDAVGRGYRKLQTLSLSQDDEFLLRDHGVAGLADTPINSVADAIATLLTNHFGFHLGQLSSCRRSQGLPPLH